MVHTRRTAPRLQYPTRIPARQVERFAETPRALVTMTKALQQLLEEGHTVDMEALSTLSPYRTERINRFGNYVINPNRMQLKGFAAWVKT
jgi:hypothetical protein